MRNTIVKSLQDSIDVKRAVLNDERILTEIQSVAEEIIQTIKNGGKILVCGNGGSAGDAQHIAGEFINKFFFERAPMGCIALSTDTSVITAIGNDSTFDDIFLKQTIANAKKGDLFWGISTSGNSKNIVKAMEYCRANGIKAFGLIGGKYCEMEKYCDFVIKIPSSVTPRIQEAHLLIEHIICQLVESGVFKE